MVGQPRHCRTELDPPGLQLARSHRPADRRRPGRRRLTQAAQLPNDGGQGAVGHALELTGDASGQGPPAQVPGLDVPLHQGHGSHPGRQTDVAVCLVEAHGTRYRTPSARSLES